MMVVGERCVRAVCCCILILLEASHFVQTLVVTSQPATRRFSLSATRAPETTNMPLMSNEYSENQMKAALASLSDGPNDSSHIYGNGDEEHKLSMLQTITATRILDYEAWMVRRRKHENLSFSSWILSPLLLCQV